jgi:hypothetical protein
MPWELTPPVRTGITSLPQHPTARSIRHQCSRPQRGRVRVGASQYTLGVRASGAWASPPLPQHPTTGSIRHQYSRPQRAMHYPHVALRQAGCKRSPWRRLPACVDASSPLPTGADRGRWCTGTNLVQQYVYAQVSHVCLTDSMIGTSTSSTPVTRMGNGMPRAGS